MADVNSDAIKALTGFDHKNPVKLPVAEVTMILEVPGSVKMIAANDYMKQHNEKDLVMCLYIFRHHTIFPNFKEMNDVDLEDLVGEMHYKDVATVILAFFGMDLTDEKDKETIEQVFRELEKDETSSTLPESFTSP